MKIYVTQGQDTSCFPVAVCNCLIYLNRNNVTPTLVENAKAIAGCHDGDTIHHDSVIAVLKAPLKRTKSLNKVFKHGGIVNIMHPIWNRHSFLVYPKSGMIVSVNSWLGPLVMECYKETIKQFVVKNLGDYWYIDKEK